MMSYLRNIWIHEPIFEYVLPRVHSYTTRECRRNPGGGEKVIGRAAPEKTSDRKLENAVPTGEYFGPTYLCYQRFL